MKKAFDKFSLDANTRDFVGHAMCLYRDDEYVWYISCTVLFNFFIRRYLKGPAIDAINRIKLYSYVCLQHYHVA